MINKKFYIAFIEETVQKQSYNYRNIGFLLSDYFPSPYFQEGRFDLNKFYLETIWKLITSQNILKKTEDYGLYTMETMLPSFYDVYYRENHHKFCKKFEKILYMYKDIVSGYLESCNTHAVVETRFIERRMVVKITTQQDI